MVSSSQKEKLEASHQVKEIGIPEAMGSAEGSRTSLPDDATATEPVTQRYENPSSHRFRRVASKTVVSFGPDDPENPYNWSKMKKGHVLLAGILTVLNSTIGSSLPSGAISFIAKDFHVTSSEELVLPISLFLVGYVVGPILCGPLSETYGRKVVLVTTFVMYTAFTLGCALSPNWVSLLVFRLLVGIGASAPISIVNGLFADIYNDPTIRGRITAAFMACTTFGPIAGPPISGFVSPISWRWTFWIGLIVAGLTLPLVVSMPESYAPVILKRRARKLRKQTGNNSIIAPLELQKGGAKEMITKTCTRPIRMLISESIVLFTSMYLSLAYAIFYIYFQAYPIIFQGTYGMSPGIAGLIFLPIGLGAFLSCGIFLWYDSILQKAKLRGASWSRCEEYRRLPLACVGGPLYVVSLFWLGWTASPNIHWAIPMLSGIPFGIGYLMIFMAMINYITDAYETLAASAQSAASCSRSIFGAVLPLAAKPMFNRMGTNWACSLMAFLSLGLSIIPFAFIRYGDHIRANSKFCQHLLRLKEIERMQDEEDGIGVESRDEEEAGQTSEHPPSEKSEQVNK